MLETSSVIILLILLFYIIYTFNRFIKRRNYVAEAWSGIDVQLKRRQKKWGQSRNNSVSYITAKITDKFMSEAMDVIKNERR